MRRVLLALLIPVVLLSGCIFREEVLDMDHIEEQLQEDFAGQIGGVAEITVTCPDEERPVEEGDVFECVAENPEGGSVTILVRQTGDGDVEYEISPG